MAEGRVLEGRRALVTGAAQGLGRAFAVALAEAGAGVAACDRKPDVEGLPAELGRHGVRAWATVADVAVPDDVRRAVDGAVEQLGGLDLVVSNAGVVVVTAPESDDWDRAIEDFDTCIATNFRGAYLVGRATIPHLVASGQADLVNISTDHVHTCGYPIALDHADAPDCPWVSAPRPPVGGAAFDVYDASKWALKGLTQAWARALAPKGVRVNSFGMGATDTPMYRGFLGDNPPTPGMMQPEQVAAVLVDLLAEGPSGRTGDSITLWAGHPTVLPPVGLDGRIAMPALA